MTAINLCGLIGLVVMIGCWVFVFGFGEKLRGTKWDGLMISAVILATFLLAIGIPAWICIDREIRVNDDNTKFINKEGDEAKVISVFGVVRGGGPYGTHPAPHTEAFIEFQSGTRKTAATGSNHPLVGEWYKIGVYGGTTMPFYLRYKTKG